MKGGGRLETLCPSVERRSVIVACVVVLVYDWRVEEVRGDGFWLRAQLITMNGLGPLCDFIEEISVKITTRRFVVFVAHHRLDDILIVSFCPSLFLLICPWASPLHPYCLTQATWRAPARHFLGLPCRA